MLRKFGSQDVDIDEEQGYLYLNIREAFFTAGKRLGWPGNPAGIGIAKEIIEFGASRWFSIAVTVGNNPHHFVYDAEDWKKLCEEKKWIYTVSNDKIVYVLPWSLLKKV